MPTHFEIETLIPAEHSISGFAYWTVLSDRGGPHPFRCQEYAEAKRQCDRLRGYGQAVRIVEITRTVKEEYSATEPQGSPGDGH